MTSSKVLNRTFQAGHYVADLLREKLPEASRGEVSTHGAGDPAVIYAHALQVPRKQ